MVAAWWGWLLLSNGVIAFAVNLPWGWRVAGVVLFTVWGGCALWPFAHLRGARAVRALEWKGEGAESGHFFVQLGSGRWLPAAPLGCSRYGVHIWVLCFVTPEGSFQWLVDARYQDPVPLRRLSRSLDWNTGTSIGASGDGKLLPSAPKGLKCITRR